jgi:hypothetical protein
VYRRSIEQPDEFWAEAAAEVDWIEPPIQPCDRLYDISHQIRTRVDFGCDSFNVLVPWEASRYATYSTTRGAFGSDGGLALDRNALRQLSAPASDFGLHPSCVKLQQMANGTGVFAGKQRLSFVSNVGTLVQPITKAQFNAWENGQNLALPVPKALFSHSDQIEQWQTAVPQGLAQLSGWAGRAADIINFKAYGGAYSHCHRWTIIDEMREIARTPREEAFVFGYLSHLAADTIAHNHFGVQSLTGPKGKGSSPAARSLLLSEHGL